MFVCLCLFFVCVCVRVILCDLEPTVEHHPLRLPRLFQRILTTVDDDVANDLDVSDTFWVVVCQGCLRVLPQLHHLCLSPQI